MNVAAAMDPLNWIAVASAEHVEIGRAQGFMQVGHGKGAPLKRLRAGDRIAYYSPVRVFGGRDACQAFTAIGTVVDERVYQGVHGAPGLASTRAHPAGRAPGRPKPADILFPHRPQDVSWRTS